MRKGYIVDWVILLLTCPGLVYMSAVTLKIAQAPHDDPCSGSVSLGCSAHVAGAPSSIFMSWLSQKEELCTIDKGLIKSQANSTQCHYNSKTLTLTVTLLGARALSQETYYCKLRSNLGIGIVNTTVKPAVCEGSFQHTALQRHQEECVFYGVYPEGQVLWASDGKDLTASSTILRGANGLFNISSTLRTQENMRNLTCRLSSQESSHAIPNRQQSTRIVSTPKMEPSSLNSSSSSIELHWPLFFTGLLMLS